MSDDYRTAFQTSERVAEYEAELFGEGTYGDFLWGLEKDWLDSFISRWPRLRQSTVSYLDFACGTGRVLAHLEDKFESATGVDVSSAMLDVARVKVKKATLIQADITRDTTQFSGSQFDLITAFRFILNAQPELRLAGLSALAELLHGPDSRLIVTVQACVPSYRSLQRSLQRGTLRNFMTDREIRQLLFQAGLECEETSSYDFLSGRALPLLGSRRLHRAERLLGRLPASRKLGAHRLLVLKASAK